MIAPRKRKISLSRTFFSRRRLCLESPLLSPKRCFAAASPPIAAPPYRLSLACVLYGALLSAPSEGDGSARARCGATAASPHIHGPHLPASSPPRALPSRCLIW
ncbi:hypothetical protein SETIT_9G432600v2 [Setaria italica]|uniref:Uncharacterized protein n=1 Tax=Setaria italica TaxID=4555 RepID=A0A368SRX6_SETIT|nr:hypothetical protein SETIT_9G432600v2 [Setaria italica]